ncbi:hypothetical protein PYCCODRAFT_774966 [Trametes coccinea BRFM310]|uniref:Uncharacterized protein n=1 Tax=Trametes coccinea (strain BRFM310) TaxID=1353009 RepID=A0A1Y2J0C8_TRAC3|nr:hypothetical protein PYCCODRAFT_774966 [Trametes coccinea BRFM310]
MLSLAHSTCKGYVERGVQTDPSAQVSPTSPSSHLDVSSRPNVAIVEVPAESSPLPDSHSRSSTQFDSAYSHTSAEISFGSTDSEANQSMTTTNRAYKRVQLPANRPSTLAERHSSTRVFSLPEATPKFRMKNILGRKTARVVSMPVANPRDISDALDVSTNAGDPFGSEDEEYTRVRVKSQATDVPYTPSAPSSPDSIVIIANTSNQLSSEFLRPRLEDSSSESDHEGWLTWTESPPRPIPALHGPLSLPYARCPSGAEGTIIEEPESLPRVIWGLDADDSKNVRQNNAVPPRSAVKASAPSVEPHTTHKPAQTSAGKLPAQPAVKKTNVRARSYATPSQEPKAQPPPPPEFILKHSEPIDLGRLVVPRSEGTIHPGLTSRSHPSNWQGPIQHQLPTPELIHDLSPDLQAMLFAQERLRAQGLSSADKFGANLAGSLKATPTEPSLSLVESIKSSRSPIVLDDLASPYGSYSQGLSSQMSAAGMAQKYRQPQLHGFLPTPPSSTSPLWSSNFSPYQGGLLSPELLAAAGLSQLGQNYTSSQAYLSGLDHAYHGLVGSTSGTLADYLAGARRMHLHGLAPAAQINGNAQRLPPRLAAEYARRRVGPESAVDAHQPLPGSRASRHASSPVRGMAQSPVVPKPPPNTPYTASRTGVAKERHPNEVPVATGPLSPTSPRETLSQYSRSIPLNKLMQRRLSIVPEEEYPIAHSGRMASEAIRPRSSASATSDSVAAGLHLYLSPSGRPNVTSLGPVGETYGTQHGTAVIGGAVDRSRSITTDVKLSSDPARTLGPAGRGKAQAVREAQRRQGSANMNSEDRGGQRYEGGRGRGHKRGGRGRKARGGTFSVNNTVHGAERVDGGMMVKS